MSPRNAVAAGMADADSSADEAGGCKEGALSRHVTLKRGEQHDILTNLVTRESKLLSGSPGCRLCWQCRKGRGNTQLGQLGGDRSRI